MKILSRYILREHIAPFLFAFFTITFLLLLDYVPKIVDQVIDKNLSIWVVLELLALNLAWMLALSVPMSVLVATLMAFGRLTSDFEITAIKASGINMLRIMAPLMVAAGIITFAMIQFNDKILPDLNKKARSLRADISVMRPTLVFRSGIFVTDIPGYLVQIDKIDHKTSRVEGVRINQVRNTKEPQIIVADYGYLKVTGQGANLEFTLYDGELHTLDLDDPDNYRRLDFRKHVINIAVAGMQLERTESDYRGDREMSIDAMEQHVAQAAANVVPFRGKINKGINDKFNFLFADSFSIRGLDTLSDSAAFAVVKSDASVLVRHIDRARQQIVAQLRTGDKYNIEIYKKYAIPAASLAFILIGAPLGVLSRRGGMGVAIAISILMFVMYWAFLIGGEDLGNRGIVPPFWAMWAANFLLGGIGLYLLYIVVTERPVFAYFRSKGGRGDA